MKLKSILNLFKRRPKFRIMPGGDVAIEAFKHDGITYYHFTDSFKLQTGRALAALAIYEELRMRCTREYLDKHIRATELVLQCKGGKLDLPTLVQLNTNLKERLNLAPFPDYIYKLASVIFFDATEVPYSYDFKYNEGKIARWKKDPEMLDFFLQHQLADLIPFSNTAGLNSKTYFQVAEQIDQMHQQFIQGQLSSKS